MPFSYDKSADRDRDSLIRAFNALLTKLDRSTRMTNSQDKDSQAFKKIVGALHNLKEAFEDTYGAIENAGNDEGSL